MIDRHNASFCRQDCIRPAMISVIRTSTVLEWKNRTPSSIHAKG
jgi:hypothetical protein